MVYIYLNTKKEERKIDKIDIDISGWYLSLGDRRGRSFDPSPHRPLVSQYLQNHPDVDLSHISVYRFSRS